MSILLKSFPFPLLLFLLFIVAYLVAALCDDELKDARQPAVFLLAAFLLITLALVLYSLAPFWLQLFIVLLLLLLMTRVEVLSLYRWLAGGLALLVGANRSLAALATLLLATIVAAILLAGRVKKKQQFWSRLKASTLWLLHPILLSTLLLWLLFFLSNL